MRRCVVLFALVALVAPVAATGDRVAPEKTPSAVLALYETRKGDYLVRLDARSLVRVSKRLPLGGQANYAFSFSPDGRQVALGVQEAIGFRIVDLRKFKVVRTVRTWSKWGMTLGWVTPRRVIGFEEAGPFVVDPVTRRQLPSPVIAGRVVGTQRLGERFVFVAGSSVDVGPARVGVLDANGQVRSVELDRIRAGSFWDWETQRGENQVPGLAVDPAGRGFVVGGDGLVAEIDLPTLAITYHQPEEKRSRLARFHNWLEPAANAKAGVQGSFRRARWLGDGKLAVTGYDSVPDGSGRVRTAPAGLSIVDTRDWTRRMVDGEASYAAFAMNKLLVSHGDSGVTAYSTTGERLYRVFQGEKVGLGGTFGRAAFVHAGERLVRIIDVDTGALLGTRHTMPQLVDPSFARAW